MTMTDDDKRLAGWVTAGGFTLAALFAFVSHRQDEAARTLVIPPGEGAQINDKYTGTPLLDGTPLKVQFEGKWYHVSTEDSRIHIVLDHPVPPQWDACVLAEGDATDGCPNVVQLQQHVHVEEAKR